MEVKRMVVMTAAVSLVLLWLAAAPGDAASQCQEDVAWGPASGFVIRFGGPDMAWGLVVPLPCCETDPVKILKGIEIYTHMERASLSTDPGILQDLDRISPDMRSRSAGSDTCAQTDPKKDAVRERVCTDADCR